MGFMQPEIRHMAAYHVETGAGTEIIPEDVCGTLDPTEDALPTANLAALEPYLEDSWRINGIERKEGFYARLSAPGYLDATDWNGPFETADEAQEHLRDLYELDAEESDEG